MSTAAGLIPCRERLNLPVHGAARFAGQLPLLDMLGGTLFMPDRMPQKYGTDDPVPPLYHQQLAYPFVGSTEQLPQPARLAEASPTSAGKSD